MDVDDGVTPRFTAELELTTRSESGRAVTRFRSDLISGRWYTETGNVSSWRPSAISLRVIFLTFLHGLSPSLPLYLCQLRWMPPKWRHALPPTPVHETEEECTHARTHAHEYHRDAAQVQRVHHAYIDDDVRGICTWRYAHVRAQAIVHYICCRDEEGESDSSSLESARTRTTDTWEILRAMESPPQRTATSHSERRR